MITFILSGDVFINVNLAACTCSARVYTIFNQIFSNSNNVTIFVQQNV